MQTVLEGIPALRFGHRLQGNSIAISYCQDKCGTQIKVQSVWSGVGTADKCIRSSKEQSESGVRFTNLPYGCHPRYY